MSFFEALLYGAVQGIAEYLPISSSAHLILLPRFLGSHEYGLRFEVFLHLGTLAATLIYFWKDWWRLLLVGLRISPSKSSASSHDISSEVSWKVIIIATLPALVFGALLHKPIEEYLRFNWILSFTLMLGGILLYVVDKKAKVTTSLSTLRSRTAFWVGMFQSLALIPGMSRSGSTMLGGRFLGLSRNEAARFSFLLSAPVTLAAVVFEFRNWHDLVGDQSLSWSALITAGVSSFLFGCVAISGLLRLLRTQGYFWFMVYRILFGITILLLLGPL